jgi:citrate synthase
MTDHAADETEKILDWWLTEIIDMNPGKTLNRGYVFQALISNIGLAQMFSLMLLSDLPLQAQVAFSA